MSDVAGAPLVLLVEASRFFRDAVRETLEAAGHACRAIAGLDEAEGPRGNPQLALVVLDLDATGEAGVSFLRELREERPDVRSIVLAPHTDQDRVLEALRLGASDYLAKPLHDEELLLSVKRALEGWRTDRELAQLREGASGAGRPDADLDLLREICETVTRDRDPGQLLDDVLGRVERNLGAAPVSLYLPDPGGEGLVLEAGRDGGRRCDRLRLPPGRGLAAAALETGTPLAHPDPAADPRFDAEVDTPEDGGPGPLLVLPIRIHDRTFGLVRAFLPEGTAPSLRTAESAAAAVSAAVRCALLYRSQLESIEEVARIRRESVRRNPSRGGS